MASLGARYPLQAQELPHTQAVTTGQETNNFPSVVSTQVPSACWFPLILYNLEASSWYPPTLLLLLDSETSEPLDQGVCLLQARFPSMPLVWIPVGQGKEAGLG